MSKKISIASFLILGFLKMSAQRNGMGNLTGLSNSLKGSTNDILSIVSTISTWVTSIFGIVALIRLIMIFASQGSGEEKMSKAGTWLFMLIFVVGGYWLARMLFTGAN